MDILLPSSLDNVKEVMESIRSNSSSGFFYKATVNIDSLLVPTFLDQYLRSPSSSLYGIHVNAPIDESSTIAIIPGMLMLNF